MTGKVVLLGELRMDFAELIEQNKIELTIPENGNGRPHYAVTVLIRAEIIDRDIKFSVRWPP
jgi:hypothetical protein